MNEVDVYKPLASWFKQQRKLEWSEITHENPCIVFNEDDEKAEVDVCLGKHDKKNLELMDVIHVKTRDNLQGKKDRYQLIGKAKLTLAGVENVWLAVEKSTYNTFRDGLDNDIGVITYEEKGDIPTNFSIRKEPQRTDKTKFSKETQDLCKKKFGTVIESKQNVFLCSMHDDNWDICVKHKLWGVPETSLAAISAISRSKPGDILLFRLNKGKKNKKVWEEFVSIWIVTSKAQQVIDGGPWKKENPDETRKFVWQVKMHPVYCERFSNSVQLNYPKGMDQETGLTTKMYWSGMVEITDTQYQIISKRLIEANLKELQ